MTVHVAKDSGEWNSIVDRNHHSVLHHRYEVCVHEDNALPLIIEEQNHSFLFPLKIVKLLGSFRIAASPVYFYASILSDAESLDLIPPALDDASTALEEMRVDYLSTCAPIFHSREYTAILNSWFKEHKASIQIIYAHMVHTGNTSFEEVWKHKFDKRVRNRIRKAKKEGVAVVKISTEKDIQTWMEDIYLCNLSALKRQGREGAFPDSYKEIFLSELLSAKEHLKEHVNIYGAVYRGHLIAYMVIQEYNKLMQVTKAMSHTSFLGKYPNEALIAYIVETACESGFDCFGYGWDRVSQDEEIPSLHSSLRRFKSKFGFEDIPVVIYRLGLTSAGRALQHMYSFREYVITRSAYVPESVRDFLMRLYVPNRRKLFAFSHA